MTEEQQVRLVREILEQVMTGRLGDADALTAITYVMDSPEPYERVALAVRLGVATQGD